MTPQSDTPGEGLAPCPFCGGEAELKHGAPDGYFVWHKCGWKGFASEMFGYRCSTEADAIAAWNRRSPSVASDAAALALIEELERVLKPFAALGSDGWGSALPDDRVLAVWWADDDDDPNKRKRPHITQGDIRNAIRALADANTQGGDNAAE